VEDANPEDVDVVAARGRIEKNVVDFNLTTNNRKTYLSS
jgi:hypothetical protein